MERYSRLLKLCQNLDNTEWLATTNVTSNAGSFGQLVHGCIKGIQVIDANPLAASTKCTQSAVRIFYGPNP